MAVAGMMGDPQSPPGSSARPTGIWGFSEAGMMELGSSPGLAVVLMDLLHTSLDVRFEVDFIRDR